MEDKKKEKESETPKVTIVTHRGLEITGHPD